MKLNNPIEVARQFADMVHEDRGQKYDGKKYLFHLESVYKTLLNNNVTDKTLLCAAYLHDIVEDCEVAIPTISNLFGDKVAELVYAVTDEDGINRKERKSKTYGKIVKNNDAICLKLADRIANVSHGIESNNERMFRMYLKESEEFYKNLHNDNQELSKFWEDLNYCYRKGKEHFKVR